METLPARGTMRKQLAGSERQKTALKTQLD